MRCYTFFGHFNMDRLQSKEALDRASRYVDEVCDIVDGVCSLEATNNTTHRRIYLKFKATVGALCEAANWQRGLPMCVTLSQRRLLSPAGVANAAP